MSSPSPLSFPLVEPLPDRLDWGLLLRSFSRWPHVAFLDSALQAGELGRYSYLMADPFQWHAFQLSHPDPLGTVGEIIRRYSALTASAANLPAFQGGAILLLSYDFNQRLDQIPPARYCEQHLPVLAVGLYDVVVAWDHQLNRGWLISQGFPYTEPAERLEYAALRLRMFSDEMARPHDTSLARPGMASEWLRQLSAPQAPQFPTWGPRELTSNFSKESYLQAVEDAVEYVRAGDVFQVNVAQSLLYPATTDSVALYQRLRQANPAPFAAYFDLGDQQVLSASPERFLRVQDGRVEARPIKGTRPRRAWPVADLYAGVDLRTSLKDRAENMMIVDLMRNDLARVCRDDSVRVSQLCQLESYEFVQHLVSAIAGELPADCRLESLLAATFPGGSVTGAPKIRAMQIINELEPTAREAYCGSLGYWAFSGALDLNILIRTITAGQGWWQLSVGGGIVADSDPRREYEETWHKATGMLRPILSAEV